MAILVIDDNEAARYIKVRQLTSAGYEADGAASAVEAFAYLSSHTVELAVLDVRLPDMSGLELCHRIKEQNGNVLVLQTSASFTGVVDRVASLDRGADAYLVEPMEPTEFLATVRALLRLQAAEAVRVRSGSTITGHTGLKMWFSEARAPSAAPAREVLRDGLHSSTMLFRLLGITSVGTRTLARRSIASISSQAMRSLTALLGEVAIAKLREPSDLLRWCGWAQTWS